MKIRSNYSAPTFGLVISLILASVQPAQALILGRKGNKPVKNVGWPTDSEKMANIPTRIAWWEGPPFGGGNYHFEYRAKDTAQFNLALKVFSQIKAPKLRLVVRDDTYKSFWLRNEKDPRLDWEFVVWIPRNWHSLYNTPGSVTFSDHPDFRKPVPPPTINLHLGGSAIEWDKVVMPANITVLDERETAPARARARQNGGVVQGFVYDFATGQVIQDARVSLRWERKPKGGTKLLAVTQVDYSGAFRLEGVPRGRFKIVASAPGFAARRLVGTFENLGRSLQKEVIHLSKSGTVSGQVTDQNGKPLAEATVSVREMRGIDGRGYLVPDLKTVQTGADGRFEISGLPQGHFQLRSRKAGLYQSGFVFKSYKSPAKKIRIGMMATGTVQGTVKKKGKREQHVHIFPIDGNGIGKWGGSMRCKNDGAFEFKNVPVGEYWISSRSSDLPKPGDTYPHTQRITVKPKANAIVTLN